MKIWHLKFVLVTLVIWTFFMTPMAVSHPAKADDFGPADLKGQWWIGFNWTMEDDLGDLQTCLLSCRLRVYNNAGDMRPGNPNVLSCHLYTSSRLNGITDQDKTLASGNVVIDGKYGDITLTMDVTDLGIFQSFSTSLTERHKVLQMHRRWPTIRRAEPHGTFSGWAETPFGVIAGVRATRTNADQTDPFF